MFFNGLWSNYVALFVILFKHFVRHSTQHTAWIILNKHCWFLPDFLCYGSNISLTSREHCSLCEKVMICTFSTRKTSAFHKVFNFFTSHAFLQFFFQHEVSFDDEVTKGFFFFNDTQKTESNTKKFNSKAKQNWWNFVLSISCRCRSPNFPEPKNLVFLSTILFRIFHHNLDFISFIVVHANVTSKSINRTENSYIGADMTML